MKKEPLLSAGQFPTERSSTSMLTKIVLAIAVLSACGIGAWILIQNALRATEGHS